MQVLIAVGLWTASLANIQAQAPTAPVKNNLQLWLAADSGITTNASGAVTGWQDQSGKNNNAVQTDPTVAPQWVGGALNGKPVIRFNGITNYLNVPNSPSIAIAGDISTFAVVKFDDYNNYREIWGKTVNNLPGANDWYLVQGSGISRVYRGDGAASNGYVDSSGPINTGEYLSLGYAMAGTNLTQYLNGYPDGSGVITATLADGGMDLKIGTRDDLFTQMKGDIAELLIYDKALAKTDLNQVFDYLIAKYGLVGPAGKFLSISPAQNTLNGAPNLIQVIHRDGTVPWAQSNVTVNVDSAPVTPTFTRDGSFVTVSYSPNPVFAPQTSHTVSLAYPDGTGKTLTMSWVFGVGGYLTADAALPAASVDKTKAGFKIRTYQSDGGSQANTIQYAEDMLAGLNGPNVANTSDAGGVDSKGYFTLTGVLNLDLNNTAADGHFNDPDYTDSNFPGIPGTPSTGNPTENFTEEIYTALEFATAGTYTFIVNSDDGFKLSAGANPLDAFTGVLIGEFDAGRGAADTSMQFYVAQPGIYPFRLLYFQGPGGANLELIVQNADKSLALINDKTNSIKSYQWLPSSLPAYAKTVVPAPGAQNVSPNSMIEVVLIDGPSAIDKSTITLKLDGVAMTPTTVKTGSVTTVTYQPASLFASQSTHTATFGYTEGGNPVSRTWQFTVPAYTPTFDTVNKNVAVLAGAAKFTPDKGGHSGQAGDFAIDLGMAGGWVHVLDASFLNSATKSDTLSFAMWIKKYDIAAGSAFWAVAPSAVGGRGYQAHTPWNDDVIYFDTGDATANRISANINTFTPYTTTGNDTWWTNWHHFVFTKKADQKNIYIDGTLFLNGTGTAPLATDFTEIGLGTDGAPGGDFMHGVIDDFAVFSNELSLADAAALASGTAPPALSSSKLMAYWNFNDAAASPGTGGQPAELGQTLNGFQDDFSGASRDPNWVAVGPGGDHYVQQDGLLQVSVSHGDPNHLIYMGPGGSNTTQEVLARLRVVNFGSGDPSRAGIGVCVSTGVTSHVTDWIGMNLNIRNNSENFNNGPSTAYHFKMLDDLRGWGPQTSYPWTNNVWYWMRLKMDPSKPDGTNVVFAKTWKADGTTPEPADWDIKWASPPTPMHGGYAGLTGCSADGLGQYEVSYVLIKSASLPSIKVNFAPAAPTAISLPYFTSIMAATNQSSVAISWFGAGKLQSAAAVTGPWQTVTNAIPPLTVPLTGAKAAGPMEFYRLQQ